MNKYQFDWKNTVTGTIELEAEDGPSGTNVAQCELSGWAELNDRIKEYKNELQEEYNKKLGGNKI